MKTKAVFHGKSTYPVRDFLDKIFSQYSLLIITYTQSDPINNENVCILMVSQRAPKQVCNAHFKTEKKNKNSSSSKTEDVHGRSNHGNGEKESFP